MCGQQDLFGDVNEIVQGQVTFGDTLKVMVESKGNIPIRLKNEDHSYIAYVYYIPTIKHNMLTVGPNSRERLYCFHEGLSSYSQGQQWKINCLCEDVQEYDVSSKHPL
jgi:hypothetical protein